MLTHCALFHSDTGSITVLNVSIMYEESCCTLSCSPADVQAYTQTLNHHIISWCPFRSWVCDYHDLTHVMKLAPKVVMSEHKTKSDECHLRQETNSLPLRQCNINHKAYTFVFVTVCACLTVLVNLLELMKSRLAPKEQQMFSREGQ